MKTLRTPEDRFADLPGFDYPPRYADIPDGDGGALRIAWVEDGPADGDPVLMLHGEPTWSYLYRRMIPILAAAGRRVICPDLVGFGRSDKPTEVEDHSYARHVGWIRALVVANTGLPTGDHPMPEVWWDFRRSVEANPELRVSDYVRAGCVRPVDDAICAAYDAPFPDPTYLAGPRAMPLLVPTTPDDPASEANRAAWKALTGRTTPVLVAFSDGDPITGAMAPIFSAALPGAAGVEHPVIGEAGHFLQEDAGEELAAAIVAFLSRTP
jgi:haloalkane dehalogenase